MEIIIGLLGLVLAFFGARYPAKSRKANIALIVIGVIGILMFAFALNLNGLF